MTETTRPGTGATVALWLFVIILGVGLGAGLFESRIALPDWIGPGADGVMHWNPDAARHDDTGRRFWAFVSTGPMTLLALINLVVGWRVGPPLRKYWLTAVGISLVERVFTFSYFIPTMVVLMQMPDSPEAVASATRWAELDYARHLLSLAALLAAMKAFSMLYTYRGAASR